MRLLVSSEAIFWDGQAIARLDHGTLRPADVDHHQILPVEAWVTRRRDAEPADDTRPRLEIAVDRKLRIGVVTDILYTVTKAGVSKLALVGATPTTLTTTPVWIRDGSAPSEPEWIAGPVIIDDAGVRVLPRSRARC